MLPHTNYLRIMVAGLIGLAGCAGADAVQPSRSPEEVKEQTRQQHAQRALEHARRTNTAEAYLDVMKRYDGTDAAGEARLELAKIRAEQAREALAQGDRELAREWANEAFKLGDTVIAQQARVTLGQIDHADARTLASRVQKKLATPGLESCAHAIEDVSQTLGSQPSPQLLREVREATGEALTGCVSSSIDEAESSQSFGPVRKVLEEPAARNAMGQDNWFAMWSRLSTVTVDAMVAAARPALEKKAWSEAFALLDGWAKDGKAGAEQLELAKQRVRDQITSDLLARGTSALGARKPKPTLDEIDAALKVFEGLNVAPELITLQARLAGWVECERLGCRAERQPTVMYNFGALPLYPVASTQGFGLETVPNGTKFWVLARGRGFHLVTRQEPASIDDWQQRIASADGWVQAQAMQTRDTRDWLPVGKALENVRVWLPSGRDDKLYLLGVVESVQGNKVTIKRLSDGQSTTVQRTDLRSGFLTAGTRVLAFCQNALRQTEARVEQVVTSASGTTTAKLTCMAADGSDANSKDELLGSLRAKPEWLPARYP